MTPEPESGDRVDAFLNRRPARGARRWALLGLALAFGLVLGGTAAWDLAKRDPSRRQAAAKQPAAKQPPVAKRPVASDAPSKPAKAVASAAPLVVEGEALWDSPTRGPALDLHHIPSGTQMIVAWRPALVLADPEGARVWEALGPWGTYWAEALTSATGFEPSQIARLTAAFGEDASGALETTLVVELAAPPSRDALLEAWGRPQPAAELEGAWQSEDRGYALASPDDTSRVVVTSKERLAELVAQRGKLGVLSREMEQLAASSDADRWLTLLLSAGFLSRAGRAALPAEAETAWQRFWPVLGDDSKAALLSAHVSEERLFCELRVVGRSGTRPSEIARELRTRLNDFSRQVASDALALETAPANQPLLSRLPAMLALSAKYTRVGVVDSQAVARMYLPASAAHHFALAGQILLVDSRRDESGSDATAAPTTEVSLTERLARRVSLRFPRTTLEHAVAELSSQIEVRIELRGAALQREGITKNQSFAIDLDELPATDALAALLKLANPEGKLVYVEQGEGSEASLAVTTRAAAEAAGEPHRP